MCLVVNPELRDELGIEINGYEDLLNPELKGKIIVAAPDASSSGWETETSSDAGSALASV